MEEIWKDIPGYDGYQASNLGRIRTHNKVTYTSFHGKRFWKDRILKQKLQRIKNNSGYRVDLWKDGKNKTILVHRIIASTFLENLMDSEMTVNHKDGNRLNNNIENLEWLSRADNIRDGFKSGYYSTQQNIKIIDKHTGVEYIFNSMSKASSFIKKNEHYISMMLKRKINQNKDYMWEKYKRED